jgi:hypothetical protein
MGLEELNSNGVRVAAYLLAAALCACAATTGERSPAGKRTHVASWVLLAGLMASLGLAREVDLGPWVTAVGRHRAVIEGWYDDRRELQFWSVWAVVGATALTALVLLFALRRRSWPAAPASLAASCIVGFVLIRAISFHDLDALLYRRNYRGVLVNTGFELGLLLAFAVCVGWGIYRSSGDPDRRP